MITGSGSYTAVGKSQREGLESEYPAFLGMSPYKGKRISFLLKSGCKRTEDLGSFFSLERQ